MMVIFKVFFQIADSDNVDSIKRCGIQYKEEVNIKNDEAIVQFRTDGIGRTNGFILYWQCTLNHTS